MCVGLSNSSPRQSKRVLEMYRKPNRRAGPAKKAAANGFESDSGVVSWVSGSVHDDVSDWDRKPPAPAVLREQNNRLRTIYEDGGMQFGRDAQTPAELERKRQVALRVRNEQLLKRDYRLDATIPRSWARHPVQSGTFIAYEFPQSIRDVVDDVAAEPFAKGAERIAFYGRDVRSSQDIVLKEYIHLSSAAESARRHEFANQLQTTASYFAAIFMADCEHKMNPRMIPANLEFLAMKTLALGTPPDLRYMSCEQRLNPKARYIRFTNNSKYVMPTISLLFEGISAEQLGFIVAFSHYTYACWPRSRVSPAKIPRLERMFAPHANRRPPESGGQMDGAGGRRRKPQRKRTANLNGSVDSDKSLTPTEAENAADSPLPIYDVFRAAVVDKHGRPTTHCYEMRRIEEPIEAQQPITESELKKRGFVDANGREFSGAEVLRALEASVRAVKEEKAAETPTPPAKTTPTPPAAPSAPRKSRWDQPAREPPKQPERPAQNNHERRQSTRDDDREHRRRRSSRSRSPVRGRRRLSTHSPEEARHRAARDRPPPPATSRPIEARGPAWSRREDEGRSNGRERQFFRDGPSANYGGRNRHTFFRPPPSTSSRRPLNTEVVQPPALPPLPVDEPKETAVQLEAEAADPASKLKAGEDVPTPFGKLHWPPPENAEGKTEDEKPEEIVIISPEKTERLPAGHAHHQPVVFDPTRPPPSLPLAQPMFIPDPNHLLPVATSAKPVPKPRVANNPPRQPAASLPAVPPPQRPQTSKASGPPAAKKPKPAQPPSARPQAKQPAASTPPPIPASPAAPVAVSPASSDESVPAEETTTVAEHKAILQALADMNSRKTPEGRGEVIEGLRQKGLFFKFLRELRRRML
ncbi:Efk-1 [Aphelenchoides fujianensis]|nr:Efk-1 [Aphelenchoides fujianensis]